MRALLETNTKFFFFGGKGGVGKTVISAAVALYYAQRGEKTLLASFNPVHSLSSLFGQDLSGGAIKPVSGVDNLYALEVEIGDIIDKYKERVSSLLREIFKWAELPVDTKPLVDIATTNPSFHEAASFDKMMDVVLNEGRNYSRIIFDMAAVANAVRLIGLSKLYGLWLQRTIKMRQDALSLKYQLSFRKEKALEEIKKDPVLNDLISLQDRYAKVREILGDPAQTRFIFVTIPTILSISVVKRFIDMVKAYDIPIGGVVVNMVIPPEEAERDQTGFLKSKAEEQTRNLDLINRYFGDLVLARVRLFPSEIVGVDKLRLVVEELLR
ncbi:MAG: ArsA family ATPase [Thermoproteus sp. AZ2]|jgi:arsenite-transporting ATPase|uniref:ArsA family ATPase n=1 Tax=Thermoproteus sp. AZ2 TaxID=1609232 RepID=A0ACC6V0G7_9CREN|nr:MAG: arsenic transporter [Thermoproteus sp. AZ2]